MLTYWNKLLNRDCTVVCIGDHTVYPIFRVGHTTLMYAQDKKLVNKNISQCENIEILIREPEERFVSGINEFCYKNKSDIRETLQLVKQGKLVDLHFAPQYIWLLHLYKFYKGNVTLRSFDHIDTLTTVHRNKSVKKYPVEIVKKFVDVDYKLFGYLDETTELKKIIKECKNVLS